MASTGNYSDNLRHTSSSIQRANLASSSRQICLTPVCLACLWDSISSSIHSSIHTHRLLSMAYTPARHICNSIHIHIRISSTRISNNDGHDDRTGRSIKCLRSKVCRQTLEVSSAPAGACFKECDGHYMIPSFFVFSCFAFSLPYLFSTQHIYYIS